MTARVAIEQGVINRWVDRRRSSIVFVTLTDRAEGQLDLPSAAKKWQATIKRLRRSWGAREYAKATEFQRRGAVHPHVFLEVDDQVADDLVDRDSRASYRRRMHELRPLATSLGWGQMVDAVTIRDDVAEIERAARYGAKSVAGYATKEAAQHFKEAGARRVRPISLSYRWVPGGLLGTRERVLGRAALAATRIEGKWERIPKPATC
jgi:hypothetical protein